MHFVAKMLQSRDVLSAFSLLSPLLDAQHPYVLKARNIVHCLHRQKYLKYCTCPKFCKPYAASTCSTGWEFCIRILPPQAVNITLPKAQQTRGLSSAYQSNFFRSYLKFLNKSLSNRPSTNFKILTKHQHFDKILTKSSFRISTKIELHNHNQASAAK